MSFHVNGISKIMKMINECQNNLTPLICSAGIGRTGVFIALDTALSLMRVNKQVCPLSIVEELRDQRPSMVETDVRI